MSDWSLKTQKMATKKHLVLPTSHSPLWGTDTLHRDDMCSIFQATASLLESTQDKFEQLKEEYGFAETFEQFSETIYHSVFQCSTANK